MDHSAPIAAELPFDEIEQPTRLGHRSAMPVIRAVAPPRRFAGFTFGQLALGMVLVLAAIWGMWATSRIFALEDRRVVSVQLAAIVNDFVTAEARSGTPPEQLSARTRAFMLALDTALKKRAAGGQVVLVGEAVVASSVPDVTADVVADLAKLVKMPVAAALLPPAPLTQPSLPPSSQLPPAAPGVPFDTGGTLDAPLGAPTDAGSPQ